MTDPAQGLAAVQPAMVPKPSCIRPRPLGRQPAAAVRSQASGVPSQVAEPLQAAGQSHGGALSQGGALSPGAAISLPRTDSRRAAARDALDAVLTGVRLGRQDRQFLSRLVHWDKRNAASVASLLWRARLAGRDEAALTQRQLEVVLAALGDAVLRASGADSSSCWDCENIPGGRCADHAKDADRARACADLAEFLTGRSAPPGLPQPTDISGYRRRTSVAS